MEFSQPGAEVYVPDGAPVDAALARTTHLGISAHQDDLEIMALDGILAGFGSADAWFTAVVATNGAGSARDDLYADYTDEQMRAVRRVEQKKAAHVGEYAAAVFLDLPSSAIKDATRPDAVADIRQVLLAATPRIVYIHNLADKHPTHVATAAAALRAIRSLPASQRPEKLYGCEVWRDLDWLVDEDKVVFRYDKHENIAAALLGVYDSQIVGGKRYDLATQGRRKAHATYHESHAVDASTSINFAMDLTPLIRDDQLDVVEYVTAHIDRLRESVAAQLRPYA